MLSTVFGAVCKSMLRSLGESCRELSPASRADDVLAQFAVHNSTIPFKFGSFGSIQTCAASGAREYRSQSLAAQGNFAPVKPSSSKFPLQLTRRLEQVSFPL